MYVWHICIHVGHIWDMYIVYMEFDGEVRYNMSRITDLGDSALVCGLADYGLRLRLRFL